MSTISLLIVDDEPPNLAVLSRLLSPFYQVRACKSGEQALHSIKNNPLPDLILLDVMMPGLSGFAVLQTLKENETTKDIPVIFITALDSSVDEEKGLTLGAVDYVAKPFSPPSVLARVRTHLELKAARDRLKKQTVSLTAEVNRRIRENQLIMQEKELLESQLNQAQKLEAIGILASGIAHDFNNILAPIIGYTEMVHDDLPESNLSRGDLEQVLSAARRARDLVGRILAFSRLGKEGQMEVADVHLIVKEALLLIRASMPSTIEILQDIESGDARVDATQIHQVVVNLCTNAAHAMNGKGTLSVSLKPCRLTETDIGNLPASAIAPGLFVELRVADTGHGMTPETSRRIFEPYFSTKAEGEGTGLGLAVVHNIVRRHRGAIRVESAPEKGTAFSVYFPMSLERASETTAALEALPAGSERILLVDEEPMIGSLCSRLLQRLGYRVAAFSDPQEALATFRSDPMAWDVIMTDFAMPHLSGFELAEAVLSIRPNMPIVLCSGINSELSREAALSAGIAEMLQKPFEKGELARTLRKVLDPGIV